VPLLGVAAAQSSTVERARDLFVDYVEQMLPQRDKVIDTFNELVEKFEGHWDWFHRTWNRDEYEDEKEIIDSIREHIEERAFPEQTGGGSILDVADRVINHSAPIVSLFLTSMRWVDDAMSPISDIHSRIWTVRDGRDLADWDGQARTAYDDIVAQQQETTNAAKDLAAFMSSWVAEIAEDNVGYVKQLLDRLGDIVSTIAAGIVALVDSWGVFTLLKIAELVGQFVGEAISQLGEIAVQIASALSRIIEAEQVLTDYSYFPDGTWPAAVDRA